MLSPFEVGGAELCGDGDGGEGRDSNQELQSVRSDTVLSRYVVLVQEGSYWMTSQHMVAMTPIVLLLHLE